VSLQVILLSFTFNMRFSSIFTASALCTFAFAQRISQINGDKYLSPYNGQDVTDVQGLVTAKGPSGFWMRSTRPDNKRTTSESIYVFGRATLGNVTVGDIIALDGHVTEYRSSPDYVYLTEIEDATNIDVQSSDNEVSPRILGQDGLNPPTQQYTSLDNNNIFGVPNNQSQISNVNPTLQPARFGMDFWESLSGELVTVRSPRAISKPNQFGDTWVVGAWPTTGNNNRGGLTVATRDANPEAINIVTPLDGTDNPQSTKLGDSLEDITGILQYAFGFYSLYPMTAIQTTSSRRPALPPPTRLTSNGRCGGLTFAQYNVENLNPQSDTFDAIAGQIVTYLKSPDLLFLQEIQDNNGATDNGVVDANVTLTQLVDAISAAGSSVDYEYVDIDPVNDQEGGEPGGNIRNAYLYNPATIRLYNPNPGSSTQATRVQAGPHLSLNPGRINPLSSAWEDSRVPLAAEWQTVRGSNNFFTVNVHFTSKGGSTSLEGDARPPVNGGISQREAQVSLQYHNDPQVCQPTD
jgi:predicted extracellular nuclease